MNWVRCFSILLPALITYSAFTWALPNSTDPEAWYGRAHADLKVAQLVHDNKLDDATVCFHAHQAVEKLLKGRMVAHGLTPERNHYNASFIQKLNKQEPHLKAFLNAARELDAFYIPSRYPKVGTRPIGPEEAEKCVGHAKQFFVLLNQAEPVAA